MEAAFLGVMMGVLFHWMGGLSAGCFYFPYRYVKKWSWETMWLAGGFFAWIIAPIVFAAIFVPHVFQIIADTWNSGPESQKNMIITYLCGVAWGLGATTFGLTMRFLGIGLGMAIVLSYCTAFGTLVPTFLTSAGLFHGGITFNELLATVPGRVVLGGVAVCLGGIAVTGLAGLRKEKELPDDVKKEAVKEFNLGKGMLVATFSGVMSAFFAYGMNLYGMEISDNALKTIKSVRGADTTWVMFQNLPVLIVVLWGGFTTNFVWCLILNVMNKSGLEYFKPTKVERVEMENRAAIAVGGGNRGAQSQAQVDQVAPVREQIVRVPMLANYFFAACAGVAWYFQFFFYSMGHSKMGKFGFSSWTLHMSSIIIFSSILGIILKEWRGSSPKTKRLVLAGILILICATIIVGYGNYMQTLPAYTKAAAASAPAAH